MAAGANAQMVVTIALLFGLVMESPDDAQVGVYYGRQVNYLPPAAEVVALYRQHNIGRMILFDPDPSTLQALRASNIELILHVPKTDFKSLASNFSTAADWVRSNLVAYWPHVRFRYIVVGFGIFPSAPEAPFILDAMRNVYDAITSAGLPSSIKVSTTIYVPGFLGLSYVSYPPSAGEFTSAGLAYMVPIVQFLAKTGAPLLANIDAYYVYANNVVNVSLAQALFTSSPGDVVVSDPPHQYHNLFDVMLDSLHAALDKVAGGSDVRVVPHSGWAYAGATAANVSNARTYNQNLIRHARASGGTPRRPGRAIETYVFCMFVEDQKSENDIYRNFGLFKANKQPVYPNPITF